MQTSTARDGDHDGFITMDEKPSKYMNLNDVGESYIYLLFSLVN